MGTKEESHLTSIIEKLKNIADDPLSAIKEGMSNLKEKIEPFLGEAKNTLFGEAGIFGQTKKGVAEEEESNRIGRAANRLAILGLTLEAMSIAATAAASNPFTAVAAVGLGITAAALVAGVGGYADGGYPTMGQMFIAREAGPELVGTIGGRTAVANNDQIVQSVAAGVYDAVAAALSANNGPLVHSLCDAITAALSRSEMVVPGGFPRDRARVHERQQASRLRGSVIA